MVDNAKLVNLGGRDFMRLHPVVSLQGADGGLVRDIKGSPQHAVGRVASDCRVLYANIAPLTVYMGLALLHEAASRKAVRMTLSMVGPGVPVFHLPYNNDQNFRVTLVDRQLVGNVDFFITEFVDGCSIYVEGSSTAPTAYHINAANTFRQIKLKQFYWSDARKRQADWAAKYARMDHRFRHDGPVVKSVHHPGLGLLPPPTKLENHDYMGDLGLDLHALQVGNKAPNQLAGQSVDGFELMAQQGTVFGERDGGNWKFFIQRRALLRYLHLGVGGLPVSLGFQWLVASVEQFWPTAKTGSVVP